MLEPVEASTALVGLNFDFHVGNVEERRVILDIMAAIVDSGAASRQFRQGINVLQLYMSISARCFYFVANRHLFGHIFGVDLKARLT
jgi:Tetracyclin repressor-like, C-terminal domain